MQWISWPLEHSHSSVHFFKSGFTRDSVLANLPGTVIIRVLVLTELREKVLQVDNSEFEFVLAQTPRWGAVSKVPSVFLDGDVLKGSVKYASSSSMVLEHEGLRPSS